MTPGNLRCHVVQSLPFLTILKGKTRSSKRALSCAVVKKEILKFGRFDWMQKYDSVLAYLKTIFFEAIWWHWMQYIM